MKVIIEAPNFNAREELIKFVEEQLEKLTSLSDNIIEAYVVLKTEKSDNKENKFCEIRLGIPGNDLFASKQHGTFEAAVVNTVDALKHQLNRWKGEKSKTNFRGLKPSLEA